jgi:hypothetical protein
MDFVSMQFRSRLAAVALAFTAFSGTYAIGQSAGLTLSTAAHNFGTEQVGQTSAAYGTTLSNATGDAIDLAFGVSSSAYKQFEVASDTCGTSIAAHSSCTLAAEFKPDAVGNYQVTVDITGTDAVSGDTVVLTSNGAQVAGVTLTGQGIASAQVYITSAGHNFGDQGLNTTSATYGAELVNATTSTISLSYSGSSTNFPQVASNCGATLAPSASCELEFDFTPQSAGPLEYEYSLSATAGGSPVAIYSGGSAVSGITLSGVGLSGSVSLKTDGHNFGPWVVDTTSGKYLTQLTNSTSITVDLAFAYTGANSADFPLAGSTCGSALLAGASCSLEWDFSPQKAGALSTVYAITATDPSNGNPVSVTDGGATVAGVRLAGNGQATAGVALASASHQFGEQQVGGGSATYGTVLYNTTGSAINLTYSYSNAAAAQNFSMVADNCGATLATNASCNLQWQFKPVATGADSVVYDITATQAGVPVTITSGGNPVNGVTLSGTGVN